MAAAYYPVQSVSAGGDIKNVQSCSLDFNQAKTPVYTFGQLIAKGLITTQLPSATVNITAAILDINPFSQRLNEAELKKTTGIDVTVRTGGGTLTLSNCYLQSIGANASVGQVSTANVSFIGTKATYTMSAGAALSTMGTANTSLKGISEIKVQGGQAGKSFSFTASVDREAILPLGIDPEATTAIDWIIKGLKQKAEAEIFQVQGASGPALNTENDVYMTTPGGKFGCKGSVNTVKTNLTTDGAATISVGIDGDIINLSNIYFGN